MSLDTGARQGFAHRFASGFLLTDCTRFLAFAVNGTGSSIEMLYMRNRSICNVFLLFPVFCPATRESSDRDVIPPGGFPVGAARMSAPRMAQFPS